MIKKIEYLLIYNFFNIYLRNLTKILEIKTSKTFANLAKNG